MNENKLITVLTPTYNRANLLPNLYNSLIAQEENNFNWLIIDDGSNNEKKNIVSGFENDDFPVFYYRKDNGGKHTAINFAMQHIDTPLVIIVDSDDLLLPSASRIIREYAHKYEDKIKDLCSFAFLRCYENGSPILELDKDEFISDYPTCRVKENRPGDMAEVYVTDKLRKYKFPEIKDERFMSEDVVWISMGIKYKTVYINKAIYQGGYLAGGLTANDKPSKFASPIGSMYRGVALMHKECGIKANIKGAIIYDCYKIAARQKYKESVVTKIPRGNALTSLMSPFGIVFYYLWRK